MSFISNIRKQISEFFNKMSKGQRRALVIMLILIVAVAVTASLLLNNKEYVALYSGMDAAEAGELYDRLTSEGVDVKIKNSTTLEVLKDNEAELRMRLASEGYPKSGLNYDLYSQAAGLGTTEQERKQWLTFQLQENLKTTLKALEPVKDATVLLTLPDKGLTVSNSSATKGRASVTLALEDSTNPLTDKNVAAIANLVMSAVDGLTLDDIKIVDTTARLYSVSSGADGFESADDQISMKFAVESQLENSLSSLLTPLFGESGFEVSANATLNFDKESSEEIVFTPPVAEAGNEGIIVSLMEETEVINGSNDATGAPGVNDNGGGPPVYPSATYDPNASYQKITRQTNHEINQLKTNIEKAPGNLTDLSVSVILDSNTVSADVNDNVQQLVSTAIGVDMTKITVRAMPFKAEDTAAMESLLAEQQKAVEAADTAQMMRLIIIGGTALLILLLLFLIIRSLTKSKRMQAKSEMMTAQMAGTGSTIDVSVGEGVEDIETVVDEDKEQIQNYIDNNPDSAAQLLRNWLSSDR